MCVCVSRHALRTLTTTTTQRRGAATEAIDDPSAHPCPQPQCFALPLLVPVALPKDTHYLSLASAIVLEFNRRGGERCSEKGTRQCSLNPEP